MTTYARREIVSTRVEYGVEAGENIGTFERVKEIAWQNFCGLTGTDPNGMRYDDWCKVYPRDDEIVFAFIAERPAGGAS